MKNFNLAKFFTAFVLCLFSFKIEALATATIYEISQERAGFSLKNCSTHQSFRLEKNRTIPITAAQFGSLAQLLAKIEVDHLGVLSFTGTGRDSSGVQLKIACPTSSVHFQDLRATSLDLNAQTLSAKGNLSLKGNLRVTHWLEIFKDATFQILSNTHVKFNNMDNRGTIVAHDPLTIHLVRPAFLGNIKGTQATLDLGPGIDLQELLKRCHLSFHTILDSRGQLIKDKLVPSPTEVKASSRKRNYRDDFVFAGLKRLKETGQFQKKIIEQIAFEQYHLGSSRIYIVAPTDAYDNYRNYLETKAHVLGTYSQGTIFDGYSGYSSSAYFMDAARKRKFWITSPHLSPVTGCLRGFKTADARDSIWLAEFYPDQDEQQDMAEIAAILRDKNDLEEKYKLPLQLESGIELLSNVQEKSNEVLESICVFKGVLLGIKQAWPSITDRLNNYRNALAKINLSIEPTVVLTKDSTKGLYKELKRLPGYRVISQYMYSLPSRGSRTAVQPT